MLNNGLGYVSTGKSVYFMASLLLLPVNIYGRILAFGALKGWSFKVWLTILGGVAKWRKLYMNPLHRIEQPYLPTLFKLFICDLVSLGDITMIAVLNMAKVH